MPLPTPARRPHAADVRERQNSVGMGIERQPAVDADQRGKGVGLIDGQPQAHQRPSAWPTTQ